MSSSRASRFPDRTCIWVGLFVCRFASFHSPSQFCSRVLLVGVAQGLASVGIGDQLVVAFAVLLGDAPTLTLLTGKDITAGFAVVVAEVPAFDADIGAAYCAFLPVGVPVCSLVCLWCLGWFVHLLTFLTFVSFGVFGEVGRDSSQPAYIIPHFNRTVKFFY